MDTQCKAEVLGKLFVIPGTLNALPDHQTIVDFVTTALNQIVPGIASVSFCLESKTGSTSPDLLPDCLDCATNWDGPPAISESCALAQISTNRLPLRTATKQYGFLSFSVLDSAEFLPYEPYIANLANIVATEMERRLLELTRRTVQDQLHQVLQELESEVAERTVELARRNAELEQEIEYRCSLEKALRWKRA
ncbi:MAG: hypothetical protein ACXWAT_10450 [Methylobacter sp.]